MRGLSQASRASMGSSSPGRTALAVSRKSACVMGGSVVLGGGGFAVFRQFYAGDQAAVHFVRAVRET
jgi:hypothetical protein